MKCFINGEEVEAKATENLGFQLGVHAKAVEYKGQEYIVVKRNNRWEQRTTEERVAPLKEWAEKKKF